MVLGKWVDLAVGLAHEQKMASVEAAGWVLEVSLVRMAAVEVQEEPVREGVLV